MHASETDTGESRSREGGFGSVGAELAAARETRQLSVETVAADLNLRPEIVYAIEAGDEARLPATAFVRGYIKSYARLLGLDESALITRLPDPNPQRGEPLKRVGMRRRRISLPVGKWLLRGLVLVAVVTLLVYGVPVMERLWTDKAPEPVASQLALPHSGDDESADALRIPEPDEPPESVVEQTEPLISEPAIESAIEPETAREPIAEPSPADAQPDVQDTAGPAVVHLRFIEDSWVEMEAHGRKLVVGAQRAGSERTVRVEPPVSLLLGNAPGVELSYRGEAVDLAPYQRGKVARVTLED